MLNVEKIYFASTVIFIILLINCNKFLMLKLAAGKFINAHIKGHLNRKTDSRYQEHLNLEIHNFKRICLILHSQEIDLVTLK